MRISEVEKQVNISMDSIRFYERVGLIKPSRTEVNGYRTYNNEDISVLKKIIFFRRIGLSIAQIKSILSGSMVLEEVIKGHIEEINTSIASMNESKELCKSIITNNVHMDEAYISGILTDKVKKNSQYTTDDLLSLLPENISLRYFEALMTDGKIEHGIEDMLTSYIKEELKKSFKQEKTIKELLTHCNESDRKRFVKLLKENNMELYHNINTYIYDIEEITTIKNDLVRKALENIGTEDLLICVKAVSPDVINFFEKVFGDIDFKVNTKSKGLGPIPMQDILSIHETIINRINLEIDNAQTEAKI